ncbi:MAG TPA: DUF4405 domain-containing protein [Spirochaetota bacterium]|nr:DUF4405 domain-containing protein [Spirochaetota bacterium]
MKTSTFTRVTVDIVMAILFLLLMAYHITENFVHEWIGVSAFGVFIIHNIINGRWYLNIFKGKYSPIRILYLFINLLFLLSVICTMVSGIMISHDVFAFLDLKGGMTAQKLHMMSSSWGYILMSCHSGLHLGQLIRFLNKSAFVRGIPQIISAALFLSAACYGIYAFISQKITNRIFLLTEFPFFDYEKPVPLFFTDYIFIMFLFAFLTYRFLTLRKRFNRNNSHETSSLTDPYSGRISLKAQLFRSDSSNPSE